MTTATTWITFIALSAGALAGCGGDEASSSTEGSSSTQGSGSECDKYLDEASLGGQTIAITNNRAATVYVSSGLCSSVFHVKAPGFTTEHADLGSVDLTCEDAQKNSDYAHDCLDDSVLALEAGVTTELTWGGLLYEDVAMAESCFGPSTSGHLPTCLQGKAPAAGTLELRVSFFESASCDTDGLICGMPSSPFEVTKSFEYPSESAVQIDVD